MQVKKILSNEWLGVTGLIVGVLGVVVSIYTYVASVRQREPIFLVAPARTEILSSKNVQEAPITVLKKDGTKVSSDLVAVRFFFWNSGREPIKQDNVLEKLTIRLDDPKGQILDFRPLKISRNITKMNLEKINSKEILISFSILEKDDGIAGQIIYEGSPKAKLLVSGIIEGTGEVKDLNSMTVPLLPGRYLIRILIAYMVGLFTFFFIFFAIQMIGSSFSKEKIIESIKSSLAVSTFVAISLMIVALLPNIQYAKYDAIPSKILPEELVIFSSEGLF